MHANRSIATRAAIAIATALLVALVGAGPAAAVVGHRPTRIFGTVAPNKLAGVDDLVARSTPNNDVFVLDNAANPAVVRHYTQAGEPLSSVDISSVVSNPTALAAQGGNLYVAGTNPADGSDTVAKVPIAGGAPSRLDLTTAPDGLFLITGLAVDSVGRVYVASRIPTNVAVFKANGTFDRYVDATGSTSYNAVGPLAIDAGDNVYVVDIGTSLRKFTSSGTGGAVVDSDKPVGVTVDRGNGDLYVVDSADGARYGITRFDAGGVRRERFGEATSPNPFDDANPYSGLSADSSSHTLFAGDRTNALIQVFSTFTAPDVTTNAFAGTPGTTSADVSGDANAHGLATTYAFDYGADTTYGSSVDAGQGTGAQHVQGQLNDLKPLTTYHYRLRATNGDGTNLGQDRTFTTAASEPTVGGESASAITAFTATLNATVNPNSTDTKARFDYSTDLSYSSHSGDIAAGAASSDQDISAAIQDLLPGTTYHYRVVAINDIGTAQSSTDHTFTTAPAPPLATAAPVTGVSGQTAQFSGTADTQGLAGTVDFVVVAVNSPYAAATAAQALPSGSTEARPVTGSLSGLPAGGVFEVRVRVTTSTGTVVSEPVSFSTASLATAAPIAPAVLNPLPSGCTAPRIAQPTSTLKAGRSATLAGTDLGSSGSVAFGSRNAKVTRYSATSVTVVVPSGARGKTAVRVTCGRVSNAVTATVSGAAPSNRFSTSSSVKGSKATVKVKVPGRGSVSVSGTSIGRKSASAKKAGTVAVKVELSKSTRTALRKAKSKRLKVKVSVRYRPTGGSTRSATRTLVFRR